MFKKSELDAFMRQHQELPNAIDVEKLADEAVEAVLLEEMPRESGFNMTILIDPSGFTQIDGLGLPVVRDADRKTAIAKAWLAWKKSIVEAASQ